MIYWEITLKYVLFPVKHCSTFLPTPSTLFPSESLVIITVNGNKSPIASKAYRQILLLLNFCGLFY